MMSTFIRWAATVVGITLISSLAWGQEAKISHGFLFFAPEKYTMDEKTYSIYEDGREFSQLIKDNPAAVSAYQSYRGWHTTAYVSLGLSVASIVFGATCQFKEVSDALGDKAGTIAFATGGGLMALGIIFEFISWSSITSAAAEYNRGLIEEGPGSTGMNPGVIPDVAIGPGSLALTWRF